MTNFWTALRCYLFCRCSSGKFCTNLGLNCLFVIIKVTIFFRGQDYLLGGQFWAIGRFNLLSGQSNILGGQMPTQLTCYLPPCMHVNWNYHSIWITIHRPIRLRRGGSKIWKEEVQPGVKSEQTILWIPTIPTFKTLKGRPETVAAQSCFIRHLPFLPCHLYFKWTTYAFNTRLVIFVCESSTHSFWL